MTMLIRGGTIHTMTERGCIQGDIFVRQGRIEAVAERIPIPEEETACILDAQGLTILPGMIDIHIHDHPDSGLCILQGNAASGVTGGLLWPEEEGECQLLPCPRAELQPVYAIKPEQYSEVQLRERLQGLMEGGYRIACEVQHPSECRKLLFAIHQTGATVILAHLTGCEDLLEEIAQSGCAVVVGVNRRHTGSPWKVACALKALGVEVALSCNAPDAKLRHLPLCAALCAREGMDRESALRSITAAPAAILGLKNAGCIKEGARADLAIYDGDPLLLASAHVMTIEGGKIRH